MILMIIALCIVFLGPLALGAIVNAFQSRKVNEELRRLDKVEEIEKKYGVEISDEDLTMNVRR